MCLICGNIGCGRYADAHAYHHFEKTSHTFTKSLGQDLVWDYVADNFVHRLIQGSIDGKMVELQGIKVIRIFASTNSVVLDHIREVRRVGSK